MQKKNKYFKYNKLNLINTFFYYLCDKYFKLYLSFCKNILNTILLKPKTNKTFFSTNENK